MALVLICVRNMHRMRTDGKSIVQLGIAPPSGSPEPHESPLGENSIRCLA